MKFEITTERVQTESVRYAGKQVSVERQNLTVWFEITDAEKVRSQYLRAGRTVWFMPKTLRLDMRWSGPRWSLTHVTLRGFELRKNGDVGLRDTQNQTAWLDGQDDDTWPPEVKAHIHGYVARQPAGTAHVEVVAAAV